MEIQFDISVGRIVDLVIIITLLFISQSPFLFF
jgi:hypothetical protein